MPIDITRAWKDDEYRNSLNNGETSVIPPNPAGDLEKELSDKDLEKVQGGMWPNTSLAIQCEIGGVTSGNDAC
jgi:mersacidin/lichenicidin family type 2 lantibiotic